MERSQELYEELQKLEATRDAIEKRWTLFTNSLELRELALELTIKKLTGPPAEAESLQKELAKRLKCRDVEKDAYLVRWKALRRSLEMLTRPVASGLILQFHELSGMLEKKRVSDILNKSWDGLKSVAMLRVRSNRPSIEEARENIKKAIETIQKMHACSISMIEQEAARLMEEIKGIDLSKTIEKTISEDDYYRGVTPQGVGKDYSGPRSGLRF